MGTLISPCHVLKLLAAPFSLWSLFDGAQNDALAMTSRDSLTPFPVSRETSVPNTSLPTRESANEFGEESRSSACWFELSNVSMNGMYPSRGYDSGVARDNCFVV